MDLVYLTIAAVAPILLIIAGKRFLGSQTHPAAIFILAWILCSFILALAEIVPVSRGILALVWVTLCHSVITLIRKIKGRDLSQQTVVPDEQSQDEAKP